MRRKFIRFVLVGVLNTAVGVGIIIAGIAAGMPPLIANALGFVAGLCVSFVANSRFTFGHDPRSLQRLGRYLVAFLVAYGCNLIAVLTLNSAFPVYTTLSHVAGIVPYTVVFFILASRYVFNDVQAAPSRSSDGHTDG